MRHVPLSRPSITERELDAVREVLSSGWLTYGEYNRKFEQAFAKRCQVTDAISLNSCTSALELALRILRVTGEVIVPSMTFAATANAVVTTGGMPRFCDVDGRTRNVTAQTIEAALTPGSQAVIVVHYAGQACAMDEIVALCERRHLLLIEDCAQALGAAWQGRQVGSFGLGCFSFFPTKNITTGEGGMLTCQDPEQAGLARALAAHGMTSRTLDRSLTQRPWHRVAEMAGHNYRLPHPLAALGYHQLARLDELNHERLQLARRYDEAFESLGPSVRIPYVAAGATHVYQAYTIEVDRRWRDHIVAELRGRGIEASVHYDPPVHLHPFYRARGTASLPVTERLAEELISLPLFPGMAADDQAWVTQQVRAVCSGLVHA